MLELHHIDKSYEGQSLLSGVSFQVGAGETVCLLGPSGSGKSTLLRIIAGLELPDAGQVLWDGRDLADTPTHRRGFGLMFQDYALFPHRNVAQNVAFGLRMQGLSNKEIEPRVRQALERVNLQAFGQRKVTDLSGGEQQRVALARALAPSPRLLMLDEPLGALDRSLREQLSLELRSILRETRIPAVYVTHDQEEAFSIADRLVLLHDGQVAQEGSPAEVYAAPASAWVARFFGMGSLLDGEVSQAAPLRVTTPIGIFSPRCQHASGHAAGQKVTLLVRPRPVDACIEGNTASGVNCLQGVVEDAVFDGKEFRVGLMAAHDTRLFFYLPAPLQPGKNVSIQLTPDALVCLGLSINDQIGK